MITFLLIKTPFWLQCSCPVFFQICPSLPPFNLSCSPLLSFFSTVFWISATHQIGLYPASIPWPPPHTSFSVIQPIFKPGWSLCASPDVILWTLLLFTCLPVSLSHRFSIKLTSLYLSRCFLRTNFCMHSIPGRKAVFQMCWAGWQTPTQHPWLWLLH